MHQMDRMVVDDQGSGPVVVLVHGLGAGMHLWAAWMPALQGFRCLRVDLPGCGLAAGHVPTTGARMQALSVGHLADALLGLCNRLDVGRAHWLGHSMGTLICQKVAVQEPARVASLALFGPLSSPPEASRRALEQRALRAREGGLEAMHTIAESLAQGTLSASTRRDDPLIGAFVRELIRRNHPSWYAQHCEALAQAQEEALEGIEAPTLLVTGDEDSVTPPQMMRSMTDRLSGAALVQSHVLRGCGHWTPLERRAECLRLWADFVRACGRVQRPSRARSTA